MEVFFDGALCREGHTGKGARLQKVFLLRNVAFELVDGKRNAEPYEDSRSKLFPCLVANVVVVGGDILRSRLAHGFEGIGMDK
ncbi:hypothetical protein L6452_17444 [Arctium lappa]|uniref:Uncharacterized protein n=1 Tax=Arctium lappa TaxID=4217 RepID=A0ACB9C3G0_ARCLA|nr:hypothetical protein L6452_17444 [Arctium lappa]